MAEPTLSQAVEQFAHAGHTLTEADLERDWTWGAYDEGLRYAFFRTYEELRELAATSVQERWMRGPAISAAQRALAQHHAAYRDLQALLFGLPKADLDRAPADGEWPLRTVLEHTIRAEGGFYVLVRYAIERRRSRRGRRRSPGFRENNKVRQALTQLCVMITLSLPSRSTITFYV